MPPTEHNSGRTPSAVFLVALALGCRGVGVHAFAPQQRQRRTFRPSSPVAPSASALRSAVAPPNPSSATGSDGDDGDGHDDTLKFEDTNIDPEHLPPVQNSDSESAINNKEQQQHAEFHHENDLDLSKYSSIQDFNIELAKLAKKCADDRPGRKVDVIGCAALAEGMLHRLEHLVRDADEAAAAAEGGEGGSSSIMRPDVVCYNTVITAWSKACATLAEGRGRGTLGTTLDTNMQEVNVYTPTDAAARATEILTEMERRYLRGESDVAPDTTGYNAAVDAWAKSRCKDAAKNAEALLSRMLHLSGGDEDGKDGVMNGSKEQWAQALPDTITYNSVIETWAYSPHPGGLERAVAILDMLEEEFERTGDARSKPNIRTVNQVINAYAKKGTEAYGGGAAQEHPQQKYGGDERAWAAANKSRRLLDGMKKRYEETGDDDYRPDAATYTSCCDAYSRVGEAAASEKAEALLNEMEREYNATGDRRIKPNFRTYTACIAAWAKTAGRDSPHRAEAILRHMEGLYAESLSKGERVRREESVKPNARTYGSVITAWVRSRDPTKPQRALRILKKMQDLARAGDESVRPNIYTYNAAIDACAKCQGDGGQQVEALKIAFAINKAIAKAAGVEANHVTYANLLKCAHLLMPAGDERNAVSKAVFKQACDAGMVDGNVIRVLQIAADRSLFNELSKPVLNKVGHVDYDAIPHEWNKHVR